MRTIGHPCFVKQDLVNIERWEVSMCVLTTHTKPYWGQKSQRYLKLWRTSRKGSTVSDFQVQFKLTTQELHCSLVKDKMLAIRLGSQNMKLITPSSFTAWHNQCFWLTYQSHTSTVSQWWHSGSMVPALNWLWYTCIPRTRTIHSSITMWGALKNTFLLTVDHALFAVCVQKYNHDTECSKEIKVIM